MTWQPIKTAPKDQVVLLWRPNAYGLARCDIGNWDDDKYAKRPKPYWRSSLCCLCVSEMRSWHPTHWQPLPQPPTQPTPDRPPLWRVMLAAFSSRWLDVEPTSTDNAAGLAYAAEIRALRDWLLPEQPEPQPGDRYEQRHIIWRHDQRLRAQLTAEADRAERGDG